MTSKRLSHEECVQPTKRPAPAGSPKLHVQRSPSKDTVTIRFSALGGEEEEEEEGLFLTTVSPTSAAQDESNVATAVEACEEMFEEETFPSEDALLPESPGSFGSPTQILSSHIVEQKGSTCPPIKSLSFPSSDSLFPTVVKSLSSDVEPRDGLPPTAAPTLRHRQLMKTLVKSLSSDTSQDSSSTSYRLPEPRLNLQLFKQFTQSRTPSAAAVGAAAGDSKTAPCSPLTSPDRGGFFKVSEVEAKFEDTKRRLSEAISEPLQLLSKIMDEKSGGSIYRPKALSASATELSSGTNGHVESNNNYCIKEEDGAEWEDESQSSQVSTESPVSLSADTKSPNKSSSRSVSLEKCSMSALAKQEDEEFCILYSDDFDNSVETEASGSSRTDDGAPGRQSDVPLSASSQPGSDEDVECVEPNVPLPTLTIVTLLVYGYFVLPLPSYVGGLLLGIGLGFLLAIGVVWLTGLKSSNRGFRHSKDPWKLWNLTKLDIKEPEMYKVGKY